MTTAEKIDLNTIPYSASLSFPEPSSSWVNTQNNKGRNSTVVSVPPADLTGKNVIISGGNNGIGKEAGLQFAAMGANLIIGCRANTPPHETTPDDAITECKKAAEEAGKKIEAEWWPLDLADVESTLAFAKRWMRTGKALVSAVRPQDRLHSNRA